ERQFFTGHESRFTNHDSLGTPAPSKQRCPSHSAIPNSATKPRRGQPPASSIRQAPLENDFAAGPRHTRHAAPPAAQHPADPILDATAPAEVPTKGSTAPPEKAPAPRRGMCHPSKDRGSSSSPATSPQMSYTFSRA